MAIIVIFALIFGCLWYIGSGLEKEFEKDRNRLINDIADEVVDRLKKEEKW